MMRPVRRTVSPSLIVVKSPRSTAPTLSSSRLSAMPNTPPSNSSISPAMARCTPCTREMPSPIEMTVPTSATSTSTAKLPIWSRMILEISSALMSMLIPALHGGVASRGLRPFARRFRAGLLLGVAQPLTHPGELRRETAVVDGAPDTRDRSTKNCRIHFGCQGDAAACGVRQPFTQPGFVLRRNRLRRRDLGPDDLLMIEQPLAIDVEQ